MRTTTVSLIATPASPQRDLDSIAENWDARIHRIKTRYAIVREKIAHELAHARRKNNKIDALPIKHGLIAMLDAIYDSFKVNQTRKELIIQLNKLLAELSKHYQHDGFAKNARHAFIHYFHQLLKRQEKLHTGFMSWFESYMLEWQQENVFGEGFDFNKWKVEPIAGKAEQPEHHHIELLKKTSIKLLEDYLISTHVAVDRFKNATILLDNIKALPNTSDSFEKLQLMLNISKRLALQADATSDANCFSFFRRHRFGSRYIALLDDLRERVLYCQNQQQRETFQQVELDDYNELKTQLSARTDDDHATRFLAEQVEQKGAFLRSTFAR